MTEPQLRALAMCEISFYRATVGDQRFSQLLRELGWKPNPSFDVASVDSLQRLSRSLRSKLRSAS